jgi:hypothetical protein
MADETHVISDENLIVHNCYSSKGSDLALKADGNCPFLCTEVGEDFCLWSFHLDIDDPNEEELPQGCPLADHSIHVSADTTVEAPGDEPCPTPK